MVLRYITTVVDFIITTYISLRSKYRQSFHLFQFLFYILYYPLAVFSRSILITVLKHVDTSPVIFFAIKMLI